MQELKICLKTNASLDTLRENLLNQGFYVQEEFQLNDIYMVDTKTEISLENSDQVFSNYLLIREKVGQKSSLVFKKKETNEKGEIQRTTTNCPIVSCYDAYNLMKELGYKKLLNLNVHNILFSNDVHEIYLQDVEELGVYIKMMQKNNKINHNNGDTIEEMINNLKKYDLPIIDYNTQVKKSYDMFKKRIEKNK